MHYKLFILALVGSYTFGQGGFMFKRPKPELIEKKPPLINEINVDSVSLKINDNLNLADDGVLFPDGAYITYTETQCNSVTAFYG